MTLTEQDIRLAFLRALQGWPLWKAWHTLGVYPMEDKWSVNYSSSLNRDPGWNTYFDGNIDGEIFYLTGIGVSPNYRKQGFGSSLYEVIEAGAARAGCRYLFQLPSGTTPRNETRRDYLLRRGYVPHQYSDQVYKELFCGESSGIAAAGGNPESAAAGGGVAATGSGEALHGPDAGGAGGWDAV